jgi:hypothetical protein
VTALQRGDRRAQAAGGEELERREDAAIDAPAADVALAAAVDLHARVLDDALLELGLAHEQQLADGRVLGVAAEERVLALGAVDRGGLEQLPAVEDRLGVDARGAATGRADLEEHVRRLGLRRRRLADAAQDGAADDPRPDLELLERHVLGLEAEVLDEVALERGRLGHDLVLEQLVLAAGLPGGRALGRREEALLLHDGGLLGRLGGPGLLGGRRRRGLALLAGAGRTGRLGVLLGELELRRTWALVTDLRLGTGWRSAIDLRFAYVYVLP